MKTFILSDHVGVSFPFKFRTFCPFVLQIRILHKINPVATYNFFLTGSILIAE